MTTAHFLPCETNMKLLSLLLTAILCATASAQTIKSLGFNTTNGQVVANTGTNVLSFENILIDGTEYSNGEISRGGLAIDFEEQQIVGAWEFASGIGFGSSNAASTTRANLGFSTNLNTLWTATNASNARSAIGLGATNQTTFAGMYISDGTNAVFYAVSGANVFELYSPLWFGDRGSTNAIFQFEIDTDAAIARTNLGLPLAALTNTSNVTMMRALAGSTNTNEPYSGTVALTNTNVLTFSNGVLLKIQ